METQTEWDICTHFVARGNQGVFTSRRNLVRCNAPRCPASMAADRVSVLFAPQTLGRDRCPTDLRVHPVEVV